MVFTPPTLEPLGKRVALGFHGSFSGPSPNTSVSPPPPSLLAYSTEEQSHFERVPGRLLTSQSLGPASGEGGRTSPTAALTGAEGKTLVEIPLS